METRPTRTPVSLAKLVATAPGCRQFTVTTVPSSRFASSYVKRTLANFDWQYERVAEYFFSPCKSLKFIVPEACASELTLIMRAGALALSTSNKRLVRRK